MPHRRASIAPLHFLLLLLLFSILAGCTAIARRVLAEPTVRLESASVTGVSREGADLVLDFRVMNPNRVTLPLGGIDYRVSVDGQPLLAGNRRDRLELAGRAETAVALPVTLRYRDLGNVLGDLLTGGTPVYRVDAEFLVLVPGTGGVRIPVVHQGKLPLPAGLGVLGLGR
jgi:LEA14-like dessication related protein